jgi:AcrR family transcriptional regulator
MRVRGRSLSPVGPGLGGDDSCSDEHGNGARGEPAVCADRPLVSGRPDWELRESSMTKGRRSTQRERLLAGMVIAADREGYARASISKVIAEAGVSRPTFYDYFADKDDCFCAAIWHVHGRLLREVRDAVSGHEPRLALTSALAALLKFAATAPAEARFLMSLSMSAGPRALETRDAGIAELGDLIEESFQGLSPSEPVPDLVPRAVIGGVYRLVAALLRRGEPDVVGHLADLSAWVASYERPVRMRRWHLLRPRPMRSPFVGAPVLRAPDPLPPGRTGLSREAVAANHRQRFLYAAAELAEQKGYNASTVADIAKLAGIDSRGFYAAFADKQEAFMAAHEFGAEQVMTAAATAFFTGETWPERVWEGGRAFAALLENNPMIAHVGFVEAYAVGPAVVQRVEESHLAFTVFIQEGFEFGRRSETHISRVALQAIITTILEIVYLQTRGRSRPDIAGVLGYTDFLMLAPFLGPDEATGFLESQLVPESATV